jgi:hypothetical protein
MQMRRIMVLLAHLGGGGCVFTGAETEGMPCNGNAECGIGLVCVERVCCREGSSCGAEGTETQTDTEMQTDTEPGVSGDPSDDGSVREVCEASDTVCVNDDVLRFCRDDGKLSTFDCRGLCGESRESLGCLDLTAQEDTCACGFDIETCSSEGVARCEGGSGAEICSGGVWQRADCDDVCVGGGYGGAAYCDAGTCYCDNACVDGALRCSDGNTNAVCSGGQWYEESCTTICRDAGYEISVGCMYFPGADSGCYCS